MMNNKENKSLPFFGIPALSGFLKRYRGRMTVMVIMGMITGLFDSAYPLFNRYVIDHNIANKTLDTLPMVIILYISLLIIHTIIGYITVLICSRLELWLDRDLRNAAFSHLQTLSFSYFNQNNVGYIHARVMSDTGKIGELCSWKFMDIVWNGSYILFMIVVMFFVNVRLAVLITLLVPVAAIIIMGFQSKLIPLNRKVRELNSKITGDYNEGITGVRMIKTLAAEERMNDEFRKDTDAMYSSAINTAHHAALFAATVSFLSSAALAVVLWQGGILNREGVLMIGTLSVFMSYAMGIIEPIQEIVRAITALITIQINIERLDKLLHTESDVADTKEVTDKYGDTFNPRYENWEDLHGDIEFKDVTFIYPDGEEEVLSHFNLKVPAGSKIAIVGETGAGKSTLVNLVCRFFEPTEGQVLIDGRDARERSQLWLHSHIGYVMQTPHLFTGTIRENLCYGKPDASDEQIMQALKLVAADGIVDRMEGGLDADVGESGSLLSTGERQLISFARAIIADPAILILDEATSSVDTVTERIIQDAIEVVTQGRTSFVVAHRLSTIRDADMILCVQDGRIVESGTHNDLITKKGYYYELLKSSNEELYDRDQ